MEKWKLREETWSAEIHTTGPQHSQNLNLGFSILETSSRSTVDGEDMSDRRFSLVNRKGF